MRSPHLLVLDYGSVVDSRVDSRSGLYSFSGLEFGYELEFGYDTDFATIYVLDSRSATAADSATDSSFVTVEHFHSSIL